MVAITALEQVPVAVRVVHLDQLGHGITDLRGYSLALVVFRFQGSVVGQAWLPVSDGRVLAQDLRDAVRNVAWPVWHQLVIPVRDESRPLPTASVVVCTRNRTQDLAQCLPGLLKLVKRGHQVIVVDNCPADSATAALISAHPGIEYIFEPRPGLDIARNRGLQVAAGEVVAFTDDDAQVEDGWLEALLANFDDPMVAVVTGMTLPVELVSKAQQWFERTNSFGRGFIRKQYDLTNTNILAMGKIGAGVNMAILRSALKDIGGFDDALDGGTMTLSGGDQEFFSRTLAHGYRIVYEPGALVWHRHRREWDDLRRTVFGYGVGVFAWWTRALVVEKEWTVLIRAPLWFFQHHVRNLIRSLLKMPGCVPLDLAWAEFRGALVGPSRYLRSRRRMKGSQPLETSSVSTGPIVDPIGIPVPSVATRTSSSVKRSFKAE